MFRLTAPSPPSEATEQAHLTRWLDARGVLFAHVPNGEHRNKIAGAKLKRMGVKPGVPDILIFTPPPCAPTARGAAVEMKRIGHARASATQIEWLHHLDALGWRTRVCEGAADAIRWLLALGY